MPKEFKPVFNEFRLRIIDKLLQKGWCSYLDMARAINEKIPDTPPGDLQSEVNNKNSIFGLKKYAGKVTELTSYNKGLYEHYKQTLTQDCLRILDVYAGAHRGVLLEKYGSEKDNVIRNEVRKELFSEVKRKQYGTRIPLEVCTTSKGKVDKNNYVKFFKYSESKKGYSLFGSGDFDKFQQLKLKSEANAMIINASPLAVTDSDVADAIYESETILDKTVSAQIKHSIRLKMELRKFESESKSIIASKNEEILQLSTKKERGWIKKTLNAYRNIMQLAKDPLSNVEKQQLAILLYDFAYFLAEENQYQVLGNRFDEAMEIYIQLVREERHQIEDSQRKAIDGIDLPPEKILEKRKELDSNNVRIARVLLSIARVSLDSGDIDASYGQIRQAKTLIGNITSSEAKSAIRDIYQLESIIYTMYGDFDNALSANEVALDSMDEDDYSAEGIDVRSTHAELIRRKGEVAESLQEYKGLLDFIKKQPEGCVSEETYAKVLLGKGVAELDAGQTSAGLLTMDLTLKEFAKLYSKEPQKILPNILSARLMRTIALSSLGQLDMALENSEEALKLMEKHPECKDLCAMDKVSLLIAQRDIYELKGETQRAEDCNKAAQEIIERDPSLKKSLHR